MSDFVSAGELVCASLTPTLRGYAQEFGLAPELAQSLFLSWDGDTFTVQSPLALDEAEFGTGRGPAPRPIHKAMNRLEVDAEDLLERLLDQQVADVAELARF